MNNYREHVNYREHLRPSNVSPEAFLRGALMAVLPLGHPVHDSQRTYTLEELERWEREFMERFR